MGISPVYRYREEKKKLELARISKDQAETEALIAELNNLAPFEVNCLNTISAILDARELNKECVRWRKKHFLEVSAYYTSIKIAFVKKRYYLIMKEPWIEKYQGAWENSSTKAETRFFLAEPEDLHFFADYICQTILTGLDSWPPSYKSWEKRSKHFTETYSLEKLKQIETTTQQT